ncbi:MAG: zinc ribbon domain-containing protein [Planctomycetes bacterium]|nr:zinc ribbon domain-containing protein [Planctomycetota bacterium]
MTIAFGCVCGLAFEVPESLAKRPGRCPACSRTLQIPADSSPGRPQKARVLCPHCQTANTPDSWVCNLCGEVIGERLEKVCPSCKSALEEDAVICVRCGYDLRSGRNLTHAFQKMEPPGGPGEDGALPIFPEAPADSPPAMGGVVLPIFEEAPPERPASQVTDLDYDSRAHARIVEIPQAEGGEDLAAVLEPYLTFLPPGLETGPVDACDAEAWTLAEDLAGKIACPACGHAFLAREVFLLAFGDRLVSREGVFEDAEWARSAPLVTSRRCHKCASSRPAPRASGAPAGTQPPPAPDAKIRFRCEHCGKSLSALRSKAGGKGRCPGCKQIFQIPGKAGGA